jgi:hypothetical protein
MSGEGPHEETGFSLQEIQELVREGQVARLAEPSTVITALQATGIDPKAQEAFIRQLDAWVSLATFAKWLSAGLAIGSALFSVFLLSAMTWDDLFAGSSLWEFALIVFALAVFVASPLTIFVVGRPLKGVDEWAPTLSLPGQEGGTGSSGGRTNAAT